MRTTARVVMAFVVAIAMLAPVSSSVAGATATIDGRVTAADGYTLQGSAIDPATGRNFGEIYITRDANRVYAAVEFNALNQGDVLNENVYGDRTYHEAFATGWNNHTFSNLVGSDHIDVTVACNGTVLDAFAQDYLYQSGSVWKSDQFGKEGDVTTGNGPVAASSSMVWNSTLGYQDYLLKSSDFAGSYPTPGPNTPASWVWEMTYEFALDGAKYAACDPVIAVTDMHNSPDKLGQTPSAPKLVVTKTVDKAVANPGDVVTWTIAIANLGTKDANDVTFTDDISALLARGTYVSSTPAATLSGSTLTWEKQDFKKGTTKTFTFSVRLATTGWPPGTTTLPNTVVVPNSNCAAGNADPTCSTTTTVTIPGNLTAQKTVDKASASPGDTLTYTITVTNNSQGTVTNASITDDISALLARGTYQPGTPAATPSGGVISWTGQDFAVGQTRTYTFQVVLNTIGWPNGTTTLPNIVVVTQSNCPPGSTDPKCSTTTTVTPNPALTVVKTPDAQTVVVGNPVGFTITVTSSGQATATNVQLSDLLPTMPGIGINWTVGPPTGGGTCGIAGSPPAETLTCSFGDLAPGQVRSVHVASNTTAPTGGQAIAACQVTSSNWATNLDNSVEVTSANASSATAQTGTCVTGTPHVSVVKTPDAQAVPVGSPVGFTITVTSDGVGTATDVQLSDALPTLPGIGINWNVTPPYGGPGTCGINGAPPNETLVCSFGDLAQGASASVHVTSNTTAPTGGQTIAACQVTVANWATNLDNEVQVTTGNAGSAAYQTGTCVTETPHVSVVKTPDQETVVAGNQIGFTITVTSDGVGTATDVNLTDVLPTLTGLGINWSVGAPTGGGTCGIAGSPPNETLTCAFGNLAQGQVRTVHLTSPTTAPAGGAAIAPCVKTVANWNTNLNNEVQITSQTGGSAAWQTGLCITGTPHVSVVKTPDAQAVPVGSPVGFTITVTSDGVGTATDVTLSDALPTLANADIDWAISPAYAGPGTCTITGVPPTETLTCTFGDLAQGASASVHVTSNTTAPTGGQTIAVCQVTSSNWETNLNNSVQVTSANAGSATAQTGTCVTQAPHVSVVKTPDAQSVVAGNQIGFTITVTSDGVGTATDVNLTDVLPTLTGLGINWSISPAYTGPGTCGINGAPPAETLTCAFGNLAQGATAEIHLTSPTTVPIEGQAIAPCVKTVAAWETNLDNTVQITSQTGGSAAWQTGICVTLPPDLEASKSVDKTIASPGETLTYTITVHNPSAVAVSGIDVSDDIGVLLVRGTLTVTVPVATIVGDTLTWPNQTFAAGQTRTYQFTILLDSTGWPNGTTTLPNTVVVTRSNCIAGSGDPACSTTTIVAPPGIAISTTVCESVNGQPDGACLLELLQTSVGHPIFWRVEVRNTGQVTLTDLTLTATRPIPAAPTALCPALPPSLAPGASYVCLYPDTAPAGTTVDTATADSLQVGPVSDPATVVAVPTGVPGIQIIKSANPTALPAGGGPVVYSYAVTNKGNVPLSGVTVNDDKCAAVVFIGGDVNANAQLDLTETWTYTCTTTITVTTTNTALATGFYLGNPVVDTDTAIVTVGPVTDIPNIRLVKIASPTTLPVGGGAVTYTFTVTNGGTVPLSGVTLVDNRCSPVTRTGGDTNANALLDLTETWTYTCTTTITVTTTNTAVATGYYLGTPVTDQDSATVTVPAPTPTPTATPTPTPTGSVAGETSPPKVTLPPTDAAGTATGGSAGTSTLMVLILLIGVAVAAPILAVGRRRTTAP